MYTISNPKQKVPKVVNRELVKELGASSRFDKLLEDYFVFDLRFVRENFVKWCPRSKSE